jgi:hypothetical protein
LTAPTPLDYAGASAPRVSRTAGLAAVPIVSHSIPLPFTTRSHGVRAIALIALAYAAPACSGDDLVEPRTGEIGVTTSTTGDASDPDGYLVSLDDGPAVAIGGNETITLTAPAGVHHIALSGLAGSCGLDGENPRTVTVAPHERVELTFTVTCTTGAGSLVVTTTTSGAPEDPDGYVLRIDDTERAIGDDETVTISPLAAGPHQVGLDGVAGNCTVDGDNPRPVDLAGGAAAAVEFRIVCAGVEQWLSMSSGTRADLPDVWGNGPEDVFVVGEEPFVDENSELASVILHYDGTQWTRQLRNVNLVLRGVWSSGPADVFAVGAEAGSPEARILRYDGSSWRRMTPPVPQDAEEFVLQSVWGSGKDHVFAVGSAFNGFFEESLILGYDGIAWRRLQVAGPVLPALLDVWGSSATDVYAVGRLDLDAVFEGVILHQEGDVWSPVLDVEDLVLQTVWGSSASDVFAAGFEAEGPPEMSELVGSIWHFDGSRWSRMTVPRSGILFELWGTSPSDVFAVGQDGVVLHYDGTAWKATYPTDNTLLGIWGSSPANVFAVGNAGTILHGVP